MANPQFLIQHSLTYGLLLGALMGITFMALAFVNPEIWLKDYPPDIQQKFGPMSAQAQRQRKLAGVPVLLLMVAVFTLALAQLSQTMGGLSFVDAFVCVFLILAVFNLVDLLVLDWLIFVTIQPRIVVLPGTEGAAGYKDYGFHLRASLKGLLGSAFISVLIAALAMAAQALRG